MHDEWWNQPSHGLTYGERLVKLEAQVTAAISRGREEAERIGHITRRVQDHGHYLTDHGRHLAWHDQKLQSLQSKMEDIEEEKVRREGEDRANKERRQYRDDAARLLSYVIAAMSVLLYASGAMQSEALKGIFSALGLGK